MSTLQQRSQQPPKSRNVSNASNVSNALSKPPLPYYQKSYFRCASVSRDFETDPETGKKVLVKYTYSPYFLTGYNTNAQNGHNAQNDHQELVPLVDYYPKLPDPVWQAACTEYNSKTGNLGVHVKKFAGLWPYLAGQHGQMLCGDLAGSKYLSDLLVLHQTWLNKYLDAADVANDIEDRVLGNMRPGFRSTGAASAYAKNAREVAHLAEVQDKLLVSRLRDLMDEKRATWTIAQVDLDNSLRPHRKWSPENPRFVAVPYEAVAASIVTDDRDDQFEEDDSVPQKAIVNPEYSGDGSLESEY